MQKLEDVLLEFNSKITEAKTREKLEEIRIQFLGKKSFISEAFSQLKNLSAEEKKNFGNEVNQARSQISQTIEDLAKKIQEEELNKNLLSEKIDVTKPARQIDQGFLHPLSKTIRDIEEIFSSLGFEFATGPEIEDDFHNFTALNIDENHPARQMQDTFYLTNSEKCSTQNLH